MHKEPISDIYSSILTLEDLRSFYNEVDHFTRSLYQVSEPFEKNLNRSFNTERRDAILKFLQEKNIDHSNQILIQEALTQLKKEGELFPVVTLKLAYDPTREHLDSFSNWFVTRLKKKVIMEILVERSLIGGAYITYQGFFKDYSVKTKLKSILSEKDYTKDLEESRQL